LADNRCPLCMEKLKNGECASCGYRLPDEENISSIYDAEPAEYPEPAPIREITPEVQMEEIYPNRDSDLKFKVRDNDGKTVKVDLAKPRDNTANQTNATNGNPYATDSNPDATGGNPYAGYTPDGVPNQSGGSPFSNPSVYTTVDTESTAEFFKRYWWLLLLSFFMPIIGAVVYASMKHDVNQYKAKHLVIIAIVLGFIIPP